MANNSYGKRLGDRKDGRQLRSLDAAQRFSVYAMPRRSDACNSFSDTLEVTELERWLLQKRGEGCKNMGLAHLMAAAYVRTAALRPGVNRFVSGRRIYARNDIQVVLGVRRGSTADAPMTRIKIFCSPTDTIYDVYRRINDAIDEVLSGTGETDFDRSAAALVRLPRFLMRWCMGLLRFMDHHDWLPKSLLDASPYHGSLSICDMGSLGIGPVEHHIYDFGNLPCFLSFGAKRRCWEQDGEGSVCEKRYVDYRITCDERIADGVYYASALKCFKALLKNPRILELPPERTEEDVN